MEAILLRVMLAVVFCPEQNFFLNHLVWDKKVLCFSDLLRNPIFILWTPERPTSLFLPPKSFKLQLICIGFFYPDSFLIFMASFQEPHLWEKDNLNKQDTHTDIALYIDIYIYSCKDLLKYCTQLVKIDCASVYITVDWCTTLHFLKTLVVHTLCLHQLYCCTFIL